MTQAITEEMVKTRVEWIMGISPHVRLELDHNAYGWTLYYVEKDVSKRLYEIAYADTIWGMFQVLKGIYQYMDIQSTRPLELAGPQQEGLE